MMKLSYHQKHYLEAKGLTMSSTADGAPYSAANDRRGAFRKHNSEPRMEIDGQTVSVNDFSQTGFEAPLPKKFHRIGATFDAVFRFDAMGSSWHQEIRFTVNRVTAKGTSPRPTRCEQLT